MNESKFEQELRALKPAAPSPTLAKRIAAQMPSAQALTVAPTRVVATSPATGTIARPQRSVLGELLRGLLWSTTGAAAAIVVMTLRAPSATPGGSSFANETASTVPVAIAPAQPETADATAASTQTVSELISSADEGLIYDQSTAEPQRQMRYTYLERHFWTNPRTGAVIEFEVPREDVVLMPVAMQ